ncbi:unknown protein [Cronobacter turicensis z3032]|uniref:Uncharacterized protein n=1 Tax=Cronobacter turicensis (strain DSM 18703 / CCUG 55852 / LMG 23827 / z3032) TaxID=693216 RepID=C9XWY8_CROTZ|nr:unknown protein [Cronobacter turicensis z3032]
MIHPSLKTQAQSACVFLLKSPVRPRTGFLHRFVVRFRIICYITFSFIHVYIQAFRYIPPG